MASLQRQQALQELAYLDPLLANFRGRKDMRPFLRRYYELAVRACDRGELIQMAHYLLEARMVAIDRTHLPRP